MYEVFEHTADVGIRVRAASLDELFADAGRGLFALIVENLDDVRPVQSRLFRVEGKEREYLLFDWLNELLFTFDTEHLLLSRFEVAVIDSGLTATAWGEVMDPSRHRPDHEVKAITYHGLKLEPTEEGWLAEVIVDI